MPTDEGLRLLAYAFVAVLALAIALAGALWSLTRAREVKDNVRPFVPPESRGPWRQWKRGE